MKLKQHRPVFWMVVIPSVLLIFCLMFFTPPALELYAMSREEDTNLPIHGFHFLIADHALHSNKYSVKLNEDGYITISKSAKNPVFGVEPFSTHIDRSSVLTVAQAESLVKPIWSTMIDQLPGCNTVEAFFIIPNSINESLSMQRQMEMTLSVSTGVVTELKETFLGETELGGFLVTAINIDDNIAVTKRILLID